MAFEVLAQIHGMLQCLQADLTRFARLDVRFNIFAGGWVQLPVDILGKPFEKRQAVVVGMVRVSLFHNKISMLL